MTGAHVLANRRMLMPVLIGLVATALVAAGCGSDNDAATTGGSGTPKEQAFLQAMVPHHESAIEMTDVAAKRAEAPEIKRIADGIANTQAPEIEQMRRIHERLFASPLVPVEAAHEELGLSPEEAGMEHADSAAALESVDPFDRAFVDEMVPHHEGAIEMANAVLAETQDAELRELAEGIVATQEREIEEMNAFRTAEYGGPAPETTPPPAAEPAPEGDHGGGH